MVVPQCSASVRPHAWWCTTFADLVRSLGKTVMVLSPWDDPVALTRAWCLWELLATLQHEAAPLSLLLPPAQARAALLGLEDSWFTVLGVLERVDVSRAAAYDAHDEEMIHAAVAQTLGVPTVNALVLDRLRAWLLNLAEETFAARGSPYAKPLARAVARLRFMQGQHAAAEDMWRAVVAASVPEHGIDSAATCDAQLALGKVLALRNKRDEAQELYCATIAAHERRADADSSAGSGRARIMLADLMRCRGLCAEAAEVAAQATAELDAALGPSHVDSFEARMTWATALNFSGDADGAEALLRKVHASLKESPQPGSASLAAYAAFRLGEATGGRGDCVAAALYFREALAVYSERYGLAHINTRLVGTSLCCLLLSDDCDDGDPSMTPAKRAALSTEALGLMRDIEPACRALMGDTNPNTLFAIGILGHAYLMSDDLTAASLLLEEALAGWRAMPAETMVLEVLLLKSKLCVARGEAELAAECANEAREIAARCCAHGSPVFRKTADNLARVHMTAGRYAEAVLLLEEALADGSSGGQADPSDALLRRARSVRLELCRKRSAN